MGYVPPPFPPYLQTVQCGRCGIKLLYDNFREKGCISCQDKLKQKLDNIKISIKHLTKQYVEAIQLHLNGIRARNLELNLETLKRQYRMTKGELEFLISETVTSVSKVTEISKLQSVSPEEHYIEQLRKKANQITFPKCKWHGDSIVNGKCSGKISYDFKKALKANKHELKTIQRLSEAYRSNKKEIDFYISLEQVKKRNWFSHFVHVLMFKETNYTGR